MLSTRENLKQLSKYSYGFFAGWGLSSITFGNSFGGVVASCMTAILAGFSLAYQEYCSHDPDHRRLTSLENAINFLMQSRGTEYLLSTGIFTLAKTIKGNDISFSNAVLIASFASGTILDTLASHIAENGQLRRMAPPGR
jgi:hypothetical protein